MSGRRRYICPNGFHRAMRLCFRGFDATKLMTSGASPIAQMSGAIVEGPSFIAAKNIHAGGDGRGALLVRPKGIEPSSSAWKALRKPNKINGCLDSSCAQNPAFEA